MKLSREIIDNTYTLLAEDEDARVCKGIPESACSEQPRAFVAQLAAQTLTKFGDALVSSRLVLAWMLTSIGSPAALIALLVPLRESLALLPQLFVAQFIREHAVRKWFWVGGSIGQALALLGMIVALLSLPGPTASVVIVALLAVFSLARGVSSVAAKDVLGKTVSKSRRGRLTGLAASAAGLATLATAAVLWLLPGAGSGDGHVGMFAAILGLAATLWLLAAWVYAGVPEVPGATEGGGNAFTEALRSLSLFWTDVQLRGFIVARMLLVASAFAIPYIVVLVQRAGNGGVGDLALMLFAEGAAGLLSGPFWGRWSDRAAQHVMAAAAAITALIIIATLALDGLAPDWLALPLTGPLLLFVAAVAHHGARVGRKTYLVDMADGDNRAEYTAVSNSIMGIFLLAGGALGLLDAAFGTASVLVLLLAVAVGAVLRALALPRVD
ncbi:MFS transporter permease [Mangrovimicrobium sediminis]|uniref:MFS transporter permease n=1 Tax=Mangrovimicrobium sediminis TaxID=2562682 RepID=A0A4Z0M0X0_9GAMM|nr:MFS transporter permease [Haliea sp. SAOS-164]TGD73018.1 MFS transporter permease [Haliea sp. SAOS-164]